MTLQFRVSGDLLVRFVCGGGCGRDLAGLHETGEARLDLIGRREGGILARIPDPIGDEVPADYFIPLYCDKPHREAGTVALEDLADPVATARHDGKTVTFVVER